MTVGTRIAAARSALDLSQQELADACEVSRNAVSMWETDKNLPGTEHLIELSDTLDASIDWLLKGSGTLPGDEFANFELIEQYDLSVSAGHGSLVLDETASRQLAFRKAWLSGLGINAKDAGLFTATGDSMAPVINDGDSILVDYQDKVIRGDRIFVAEHDNEIFVKRIQKLMGGLTLTSVNNDYAPIVFPAAEADQLHIIGRVRWIARSL